MAVPEGRHQYLLENHILERFTFSNGADQTAGANLFTPSGAPYTIVVADVGQICYRSDIGVYYRLISIGPLVWAAIAGGGGGGGGAIFSAENKDGTTISAGMAVARHSSGSGFVHGDSTDNSKNAIGIAIESILTTISGDVQVDGVVTLADWTAATGSSTLTALGNYFLGTGGQLTTTPPTTTGYVVQFIGRALSSTSMEILTHAAILL